MDRNQYDFVEFIKSLENRIESEETMSVWIPFDKLERFTELIGGDYFCDDAPDVTLLEQYVWINCYDYIEYMDIDKEIFAEVLNETN